MANSLEDALQDLGRAQQELAQALDAHRKAVDDEKTLKKTKDTLLLTISATKDKISALKNKLNEADLGADERRRILQEIVDLEADQSRYEKALGDTETDLIVARMRVGFTLDDVKAAMQKLLTAIAEVNQQIGFLHR